MTPETLLLIVLTMINFIIMCRIMDTANRMNEMYDLYNKTFRSLDGYTLSLQESLRIAIINIGGHNNHPDRPIWICTNSKGTITEETK